MAVEWTLADIQRKIDAGTLPARNSAKLQGLLSEFDVDLPLSSGGPSLADLSPSVGAERRRPSKYGAVGCVDAQGHRHDSKLEARFDAEMLDPLVRGGALAYYLRQVPIDLPGGVRMVVDRQLHWADGRVEYVDVKGLSRTKAGKVTGTMKTEWRNKARQAEELFPIRINVAWWDRKAREWRQSHWKEAGRQ